MDTSYRLLFLDIDGTLVGASGTITPRTLLSLHRTQEVGCTPVLCTGRNRHSATQVATQIGGRGYGIVLNGALVFDWETGAVLRQSLIPIDVARQAITIAQSQQLAPVWYGTETQNRSIYTDRRVPLWPRYEQRNAYRLVYCDDLAAEMPSAPASLVAYGAPETTSALAEVWLQTLQGAVRAYAGPTGPYESWYAQLTAVDADKALAAQAVAEALGIPREQTMAIGDQSNDRELLRWAGLGVCMGDGQPEAQACADYITGTLAEDGVAQAIERFILPPR